jgi:GntR family transcriptional repressor for pyruvate dehydrogenase complex
MLNQVERITTTQAIVDQIIDSMKRGELKPGDRLPSENEMMVSLGVGRSSIREAKQILSAMGLIEAYPGRGSFIKKVTPETFIDPDIAWLLLADEHVWALHEARELLEVQVARLAAERATKEDLAAMESALIRLEEFVRAGESVYDVAGEFHQALVRAAHNPVLVSLYQPIIGLLQEYQRPIYERYSDPQAELSDHRKIYESICQRDSALVQKTMHEHLQYVAHTTKQAMTKELLHE